MKLDKAFPPTPQAFENALHKGIREGEKRMKMKYKLRLATVAACLAVCLFVIACATGTGDRTDNTSAGAPEGSKTDSSSIIGGADEATSIILVAATPSPTPENAPYPRDDSVQEQEFYITEHGTFYHNDPTCSGMTNAFLVPISEAREEGKQPCPICVGEMVYATANGRWYHSDPYCQGMQNAGEWSVINAEANGKLPCPVCLGDRSIDLGSYREKALNAMNAVFPGCVGVFEKHYNIDQLYAQAYTADYGIIRVDVSAAAVTVAVVSFDGNETHVEICFNDVEICRKILACRIENTLSDKLIELYSICKGELIDNLLNSIHNSVHSLMPVSGEFYNLQTIELNFIEEECMTATFHFETQYYCEASFTFDLVEGDALRQVTLRFD